MSISFKGYEILEILPQGGMSTVYKVRQLSLDRIVAIKALPPTMGGDSADVEKFMAEARITAGLKHPNIVQVYDFGVSDAGVYYFVMEYISGYSVAAWIRRKKYLSEENSLLCALSIAAAMNYAWQKVGIVHCDIKPDNVIIDGDGTVKLGDLGLAMSVKSIFGQARSKNSPVFGTPNYISPEQSRGDDHLDCRADIYSLGAMLYHCMTGTMPFAGIPPLEVMDRQITDQIPDPQDVNPSISVWSACLIEKMMAKDRNYRQKDWAEAIHDLSNARSEMMPQGILPPEITSTIKRSAMRELRVQEVYQPAAIKKDENHIIRDADGLAAVRKRLSAGLWQKIIISAAGIALLLTVGWSMLGFLKNMKTRNALRPAPVEKTNDVQVFEADSQKSMSESQKAQADREHMALQQYEQVVAWFMANPAGLNEAVLRFRKLADETEGTKCSDMARQAAKKLEQSLAEMTTIMVKLDEHADSFAAQNLFLEAAAIYEKYKGPYERETAGERKRKEQSFLAKQTERLAKETRLNRLAERQVMYAADEIAMILIEDDVVAALGRMKDISSDLPLISTRAEFKDLAATLEKSAGADRRILDSFRMQKDQEINIVFLNGTQKLFIRDVQSDLIVAEEVRKKEQGIIVLRRVFTMKDLALTEKIGRIGNAENPASALMRVMLAVQDDNYQLASAAATRTGPLLSRSLVEAIAVRSKNMNEWRASQSLAHVFRRAGIYYSDSMPDTEACLNILKSRQQPFRQGAMLASAKPGLNRAVGQFRSRFGSTEIARLYDGVLEALTNTDMIARDKRDKTAPAPASPIRLWRDSAERAQRGELSPQFKAGEPPKLSQQITESIIMKMIEQNSGLRADQVAFQADDSGRIIRVEIVSMHLRDIRALENLADIQQLICAGVRQNIWLQMPVIAPLSDLMPLKKMSLRELTINHTRVKDISALSQMPLSVLNLAHTKVNDLQPLKEMPLKYLDVSFTPLRDIRPLAGLSLVHLNVSGTEISDLSPLSGMPIRMLSAVFTKVRDLSPLGNMPLNYLAIRNTEVTSISPLRGIPLEYLDLADTRVRDISALRGMSLRELDLNNTRIKSLDGLEQMPLESLKISGTGVRDISLLKNIPLKSLDLRNTGVTDLTPIQNSFIEEIWLDDLSNQANSDNVRDIMAVLQTMPRLKSVNGKPLREWSGRNE